MEKLNRTVWRLLSEYSYKHEKSDIDDFDNSNMKELARQTDWNYDEAKELDTKEFNQLQTAKKLLELWPEWKEEFFKKETEDG